MSRKDWTAVDDWMAERLLKHSPDSTGIIGANQEGGLPSIDVSPLQGGFLSLIVRLSGAKRVLEIGTLGAYSAIWMAGALGIGGRVVTLELEREHAEVARANILRAGLSDKVLVRTGPALATMKQMRQDGEPSFDLVFIDANKDQMAEYLDAALHLAHPGTLIIADNVVRNGEVADAATTDANALGVRAFFDAVHANPKLQATALQTVGVKGWDGFAMVLVR
jgi:predicted O-methyltransferase YrrM